MNLIRSILIFCFSLNLAVSAMAGETSYPLFQVEDMDGKRHEFQNILSKGKTIALIYWQTWCASCRKEAPKLAQAAKKHESSIQFFGVVSGTDEFVKDEKVRSFAERAELKYPQIRDRDLTLTEAFQVKGTPTIIVIGQGGSILYRGHHAPDDWPLFQDKSSVQNIDHHDLQREHR